MVNELRYAYGTRTNKWHLIDSTDRDFNTAIKKDFFESNPEEVCKALYLRASIILN